MRASSQISSPPKRLRETIRLHAAPFRIHHLPPRTTRPARRGPRPRDVRRVRHLSRRTNVRALVAEDTLYLKVDDGNRAEFEARGLLPFRYEMRGERKQMDYWQPPTEALDDREMLCEWARKGCEAAERAAAKKKRKA